MLTKLCVLDIYILEVKNIIRDLMIAFKSGRDYLEPHCQDMSVDRLLLQPFAAIMTRLIALSYQLNFIKLSTFHSSFYIRSHLRAVEFEFWSLSGFTRGHQIFVMIIRAP